MKIRKYILFAVLLLLLPLSIAFDGGAASSRESEALLGVSQRVTVLCAGLDEAAGNTDVLVLITMDPQDKEITVLQIPRDTYFSADTVQRKVNQLYPTYCAAGQDRDTAMARLTRELSDAFGIKIDHYAAMEYSSIAYLVDRLGGITLNVPVDIRGQDGVLIPTGNRTLNGQEALSFIRYRAGYAEGDLARVDAQKLLLLSVYKKAKNELSLTDLAVLIPDLHKRVLTDMTVSRQISIAYAYIRDRADYTVRLVTLPGVATRADGENGTWYYVVNKKSASGLLERYFDGRAFDPGVRMTDAERTHFTAIYESNTVSYRIYTEETINELEIKTKQKDG